MSRFYLKIMETLIKTMTYFVLNDEKIVELLHDIDFIAQAYNYYDYGLPIGIEDKEGKDLNKEFIECIRQWLRQHGINTIHIERT